MNAIKLPVIAYKKPDGWRWEIMETGDDGITICNTGDNEAHAHQIALALNCHDTLVGALGFYESADGETTDNDGGDCARAALAKVEDLRKTNTKQNHEKTN